MAQWIDACAADDIEEEDLIRFDHGDRTFAIYRSPSDEYFCTDGLCTHEKVHLEDGLVGRGVVLLLRVLRAARILVPRASLSAQRAGFAGFDVGADGDAGGEGDGDGDDTGAQGDTRLHDSRSPSVDDASRSRSRCNLSAVNTRN